MNFLRKLEPTTAAVLIAGILAITLIAIFGGEKLQIAVAGVLVALATAFGRSLLKPSAPTDDEGSNGPIATILVVLAAAVCLTAVEACATTLTPAQQTDVREGVAVVDAGCKAVSAVTNDGTSNSICATATEIGDIVSAVSQMQDSAVDAGWPHRGTVHCASIPDSHICATQLELALAIDGVRAKREKQRASVGDGGAL